MSRLAAHHRPESVRRHRAAPRQAAIYPGHHIGLLGGEAALLEREVGAVSRGVTSFRTSHAGVIIHRDEAAVVGRKPIDRRALHRGQGDDHVGIDPPVAGRQDQRVALLVGALPGYDLDPARAEELGDG